MTDKKMLSLIIKKLVTEVIKVKLLLSIALFLSFSFIGFWGLAEETTLTIVHPLTAQFEIISPQGTRVMIDVANEKALSYPATEKDILLTTHGHADHVCNLINTHKGPHLTSTGELRVDDVYIRCIPSAHQPGDKIADTKATNYLFLIETAGLRIVHFGDIGQDELLPWQLEKLGRVDIALMPLYNDFSIMDMFNLKAFNLMDQVKPRLIISTHNGIDCARHAAKVWDGYFYEGTTITLRNSDLKTPKTKVLFMGDGAKAYGKMTNVPRWPQR